MTAAISDSLQPVWVGDSNTAEWDAICGDRAYYTRLIDWLRSEGFDENITYRVEVYLLDVPFARIFQYATNEQGQIKVNEATDDVIPLIRTAILSSLPPIQS